MRIINIIGVPLRLIAALIFVGVGYLICPADLRADKTLTRLSFRAFVLRGKFPS